MTAHPDVTVDSSQRNLWRQCRRRKLHWRLRKRCYCGWHWC